MWRVFLNVALLAFVVQRGAGVAMAYLAHASPWLMVAFVLQCVAGLVAAIAVWLGRRMERSLIALAATVVVSAVIQVGAVGGMAVPGAIAQAMFAVLAVAGVLFLMRNVPEE